MKKSLNIHVVRPCSREQEIDVGARLQELVAAGHRVTLHETSTDPKWPIVASTVQERLDQFEMALRDPHADVIWCARGGYGASDLLPYFDWRGLRSKSLKPKTLIGFSDFSAILVAFYVQLGWRCVHGPMPLTKVWRKGDDNRDVDSIMALIQSPKAAGKIQLEASHHMNIASVIEGFLFGGCLSVVTNLIGTPYMPKSLRGAILFFEDIHENPGRMMRALNQWFHASLLFEVKAVVFGECVGCFASPEERHLFLAEIQHRFNIPAFSSVEFGHISPNMPLMLGAHARIAHHLLEWEQVEQKDTP